MLSFLLIYWIWKPFSNLAIEYDKNKWTYFFLGLLSYFFVAILFAILYVVIIGLLNGGEAIDEINYDSPLLNILCSALGALGCYGVYKILEGRFQKERVLLRKEGIENIGAVGEN